VPNGFARANHLKSFENCNVGGTVVNVCWNGISLGCDRVVPGD
jgi:hypothetical protein